MGAIPRGCNFTVTKSNISLNESKDKIMQTKMYQQTLNLHVAYKQGKISNIWITFRKLKKVKEQ